ncbi:MAG: Asp23/Gls24 family envelope stress response protein [Rhabdochlamydiaceae bacterium]
MLHEKLKHLDVKEVDLPDTVFISHIENKVFQSIVAKSLSHIEGIAPLEINIIQSFLGWDNHDGLKGIHVEQEEKTHSVKLRIEVNLVFGFSIPQKSEEIQNKVAQDVSQLTGLHVSLVHVIFKDMVRNREDDPLKDL